MHDKLTARQRAIRLRLAGRSVNYICSALGRVGTVGGAGRPMRVLAGVVQQGGAPAGLRSDNGPEFIAKALRAWLAAARIETLYIEPGAPWENGYAESNNSKLRDEFLEGEEFRSVLEARVLGREWKREYNEARPHSALGYRTPAEFGETCPRADSAKPTPSRGHDCSGQSDCHSDWYTKWGQATAFRIPPLSVHLTYLAPFAVWLAFPASDYYGASVPIRLSPCRESRVSCVVDVQVGLGAHFVSLGPLAQMIHSQ